MISVILATYNERPNIRHLIQQLFAHCPAGQTMEIVVVDDDSPDGTYGLVKNLYDPRIRAIRRTKTRGLASAFNRGIMEARGEFVAWMDADMCMPPAMIPKMYDKITREGYDAVIGSRYAPGGQDDRQPLRRLSSQMINGFARLVLGHGIRDYDSGFIMVKREVFDAVSIIPIGYGEYFIEFVYNLCQKGLRVCELGYYFRDRAEGQGATKSAPNIVRFLTTGLFYVLRIVVAKLRFRR